MDIMDKNEEFRRIPGWPQYFISKTGEIKRMQRRGHNPYIRPNIDGEPEVTLKEDQTRFSKGQRRFKVKDLIKETWPEID